VVLGRETQFIEITEAVHALIINAQLEELRASARLHQVFTELAVSGAAADEIVRQAAALSGGPVILENLAHQVLACEPAAQDTTRLLASFAARSRAVVPAGRTGYDPNSGWLVTVVGARGEDWGRLIMVRGAEPAPYDVALIERVATTLALARLLDRQRESVERQAHRTILGAFLGNGYADPDEAEARVSAPRAPGTQPAATRTRPAPSRYAPGTGCRTCGCAGCCTCCGTTRGCRPSPSASSGRCCCTTTRRIPS
jgi:PucR family transcriptional regulator, purine catabolism regulatory protein